MERDGKKGREREGKRERRGKGREEKSSVLMSIGSLFNELHDFFISLSKEVSLSHTRTFNAIIIHADDTVPRWGDGANSIPLAVHPFSFIISFYPSLFPSHFPFFSLLPFLPYLQFTLIIQWHDWRGCRSLKQVHFDWILGWERVESFQSIPI